MKVAFVLYDRVSYVDFFGFYDVIVGLKDECDVFYNVCALKDEIKDEHGLKLLPETIGESLDGYDMVFIPGGVGAKTLIYDDIFLSWLKSAKHAKYKVCSSSGTLLLGASGLLKDKEVASRKEYEGLLKPFCKECKSEKIVLDADIISSNKLRNSVDLGLFVANKIFS